MSKDINRYSYSRLSAFKTCPHKHNYIYIEQIETAESPYTIPGKLFHKCVEQLLDGKDCQDTYDEFRKLCMSGKLELEPDLLEYLIPLYFQYYSKEYDDEEILMVEKTFTEKLDGDDNIVIVVDQAVRKKSNNYIYLRDLKTTEKPLKYTQDDVTYNSQLLLYVPYVENDLNEKINAIQIDEIRLAKLQDIPCRKDGTPTTDKRQLSLVTYEAYKALLDEMGISDKPEYQATLEYLAQRGHPLFNRVTAQLLDDNVVSLNAQDILKTYEAAKTYTDYRVKGPLCNYCAYKELCDLDYHNPDTQSREAIINKLK